MRKKWEKLFLLENYTIIPCKIAQNNVFKVQGLIVSSGQTLTAATILKKPHNTWSELVNSAL